MWRLLKLLLLRHDSRRLHLLKLLRRGKLLVLLHWRLDSLLLVSAKKHI
jgi:hypothetical protein